MTVSTTMDGLKRRMERRQGLAERKYTMEEVHKHCKTGDLWIVVNQKAYDVSGFDSHPGGMTILEQCAGKDVTDSYLMNHPQESYPLLEKYYLGEVEGCKEPNQIMKEFHELDSEFRAKGFYKTDLWSYVPLLSIIAGLMAVALLPFVYLEQNFLTMTVSAIALGMFWQQCAFIGHDVGHNSIFHDRLVGDYIGSLFVVMTFGVSGQWWKQNHNCHHVVTNSINGDPDIQYLPLFMVDSKMAKGFYSLYHKTKFVYDAAAAFMVRYQHITYFPVMALARHNLYLQSWLFVINGQNVRLRYVEVAALLVYAWWLAELVLRIEDGSMALYWWLLAHATCGLLHVQITLSHFSMECFENAKNTIYRSEDDDFVRHQCATSLDVDCYTFFDWFHGGLQFQTVHHLWPRIPRCHLRKVKEEYFMPFCERHGITYHQQGWLDCVAKTVNHLRVNGAEAAKNPAESALAHGLNLEG
eukprot:TRINITY_DN3707_c0_g1_i1.p1 TRINITY_DN3707_c0_g1~~TRINITY_DN3707_c0_g1_i1.p1  ORF type:complete len:469 (+),score=205.49 TRINITY_DN3707_c0_g1_i1:47-1453(+)